VRGACRLLYVIASRTLITCMLLGSGFTTIASLKVQPGRTSFHLKPCLVSERWKFFRISESWRPGAALQRSPA